MPETLLANNRIWAANREKAEPGFFQKLSEQQSPRFLWIGCADSRVPANEIVGLAPGEVFVHRNVANLFHPADLNCLSVLQFAIQNLKVKHIIVCGHYGCGGVKAALEDNAGPLTSHWLAPIVATMRRHQNKLDALADDAARIDALCELSVMEQVAQLASCPILEEAWAAGQPLKIHGWIYGLKDGLIRDLKVSVGEAD